MKFEKETSFPIQLHGINLMWPLLERFENATTSIKDINGPCDEPGIVARAMFRCLSLTNQPIKSFVPGLSYRSKTRLCLEHYR